MNKNVHRDASKSILEGATALIPMIKLLADRIDREGAIPEELLEAMRRAGIFRMTAPRSWGGPELDPIMQFRILETLSAADGSTGWCAYTGATSGYFASCLAPEVARSLYCDIDVVTAGTPAPTGRAVPVEGGYRVSGRWSFGSGIRASTWVIGGCVVESAEASLSTDHEPQSLLAYLPSRDVTVIDNWNVIGLRGTGSHDYAVEDLFVPSERTFNLFTSPLQEGGPMFRLRNAILFNHAAVMLGIARGAVEAFSDYAKTKRTPSGLLSEQLYAVTAVAKAEAMICGGRSYCLSAGADILETLSGEGTPSLAQRAHYRNAITHAHEMATSAVDLLFHSAGASAVRMPNALERAFRDVHVGNQHQVASPKSLELIGTMLLGSDPGDPLF